MQAPETEGREIRPVKPLQADQNNQDSTKTASDLRTLKLAASWAKAPARSARVEVFAIFGEEWRDA